MPFFHDVAQRTVYAVEEPVVIPDWEYTRGGERRWRGCTVLMRVELVRADNWLEPATREWHFATSDVRRQRFDRRDTEDRALSFFRQRHASGLGTPITRAEFDQLRAQYEAEALSNRPPGR